MEKLWMVDTPAVVKTIQSRGNEMTFNYSSLITIRDNNNNKLTKHMDNLYMYVRSFTIPQLMVVRSFQRFCKDSSNSTGV